VWVTRIGVFLLENTIDYKYKWVAHALNELALLAFYVVVGVRFRPGSNAYARVHTSPAAAAAAPGYGGGDDAEAGAAGAARAKGQKP
jgi:hypothetical protein